MERRAQVGGPYLLLVIVALTSASIALRCRGEGFYLVPSLTIFVVAAIGRFLLSVSLQRPHYLWVGRADYRAARMRQHVYQCG